MKKSIAIDMDEVLADVESQFISWYEKDYGMKILQEDLLLFLSLSFPYKDAVRKFISY